MKNKKYFISIIAVLIIFTLACSLIPTGASTATPEEPAAPAPTQAPPDAVAPPEAPTQDPDSSCEGIVVNGACSEKPFQNPETARCFDYDETGIETTVTYQFTLTSGRLVIDAESVEGQFSNGGLL
ncbi:hypothetical protein KKA49_00390, partial [Patescibacteria group bacterium]|nr:hypothetical protein [Patescibacteria group bacterium]MBU1457887.1 hypothetical protein [Patescibacteria group bacterium]